MSDGPNVVLVVWDAVRASNTSLYGYERDTTPNLSDIASESVTFAEARAPAPWTLPSHASMFTGLYPRQHGTTSSNLQFNMPQRHIADRLSNAGYKTGLFTSNTYLSTPSFGMTSAFDFVFSDMNEVLFKDGIDPDAFVKEYGMGAYVDFFRAALGHDHTAKSLANGVADKLPAISRDQTPRSTNGEAETYVDGFLNWIDNINQPFFGVLNLMDAHAPYDPPTEYTKYVEEGFEEIPQTPPWLYLSGQEPSENLSTLQGLYDGCINYLDKQLDYLYRQLDERDLLDDTLLVITGDHGEAFGETAEACRECILYGHTQGVEEVLLHVPLVIRFPNERYAGEEESNLVSLKNLYYTILEETKIQSVNDEQKRLHPNTVAPKWLLAEWEGFTETARNSAAEQGVDLDVYDQSMYAYYENTDNDPIKYLTNGEDCECAWLIQNGSVGEELTERHFEEIRRRFISRTNTLRQTSNEKNKSVDISQSTRKDLEDLGYI